MAVSTALLGALAAAASAPAAAPPPGGLQTAAAPRYVEILWDPATPAGERKLWTVYLYTRAAAAASESDTAPLPLGVRPPTFEEEVRARRVTVGLFRQLERDDPDFGSRYFDDLDRVEAAGFMREYVWRYLKQPSWPAQPPELQLAQFDAWRAVHLRYHVPITYGRIAVRLAAAAR
ncbi:MAG TPA: hypothetical protein VGI35_02300 [Steroidobacteraceae bacterium]